MEEETAEEEVAMREDEGALRGAEVDSIWEEALIEGEARTEEEDLTEVEANSGADLICKKGTCPKVEVRMTEVSHRELKMALTKTCHKNNLC